MHLPKGPSMLEVSQRVSQQSRSGDRRSALSAIKQLKSGTVLSSEFPAYTLKEDYVHPLDEAGQELEKAAVADVTPESTMDFLTKITQFPTRSYSNSAASDKVEHFLKDELEGMGLHTCFHSFAGGATQLTNIVAHLPGKEPGSVTVGAHYDSRPFDGKAPGAEDNGSGLASMLALAKAFTSNKVAPKRSVYFVAFAGEEPGLLGSKAFADALHSEALPSECSANGEAFLQIQKSGQKRRTAESGHRAIIMDEIGWLSPKLTKPTVNLESYDGLGSKVMQHLRQSTMLHNGDSMDVVHNANPFGSDHMSFLDLNMEAALTINGDDEAYPNYHQSTDTIDNVNGDYMAKIAKMNMGGLMRMCMA
jgi:Zn-dependent M28 family amino/carboxypeptidase